MIQIGRALTDVDLKPPIRSLFVYNSNPAAIAPNAGLVRRGLEREDLFTIVHDLFVTETARYADYLLPAASFIEQDDLLYPWGHTYVTLNRAAIPPRGEAVSNTELFRRLAAAMGWDEPELRASDEDLIRAALGSGHPLLEGITYERLRQDGWAPLPVPNGHPRFAEGFPTPSGRCELFTEPSPAFVAAPEETHPLALVSAKTALHFLNTSYSMLPRHARAEGEPAVEMDAADATSRGIADGDLVRVFNARGELQLPARVRDSVRPGVVAIAHGRSANLLTSDGLSDLGGGGDFYGTRVEVEAAG